MGALGDRAVGAGGLLIGLAAMAEGWRIPAATATGEPGTRLFPLLLGAIISAFSLAVILRPERAAASGDGQPGGRARLWGTVAVLAGYTIAFERLGFLVATPIVVATLLAGYGERRWTVIAGVSLGATAATYVVFARWLGASLPLGILGR